jgi:hypothetical protein
MEWDGCGGKKIGDKQDIYMYGQLHIHQKHNATSTMYMGKLRDISMLKIIINK